MNRAITSFLLTAALALSACGARESLPDCRARRDALARFSEALLAEPSNRMSRQFRFDHFELTLVEVERDLPNPDRVDYLADRFTVTVTAAGLDIEGDPVEAERAIERLTGVRRRIDKIGASRGGPPVHEAGLQIAPDARWSDVVVASNAMLVTGFDQQAFLFARKVRVARPGPSKVDAELAKIRNNGTTPVEQVVAATRITERLASVCSASDLAALPEELQPGDCRCRFDTASAMAVMWFIHTPDEYSAAPRTIGAADPADADAVEVAFPPDTTWAVAHRAIVDAPAGKRLVLVAR